MHKVGGTATLNTPIAGLADPELISSPQLLSMLQRNSTESDLTLLSPPFCLCILPPAAGETLQVNLTVSSSVRSSRTSYWPLCSGGRLSQETMWQLQGITVNLKKKEKKGFKPEECTSRNDFSTIPHQTLSKGEPHYIPHTAEKPSRLDASTRDGNSDWTKTRCWWFLGTNRTGRACYLSTCIYL